MSTTYFKRHKISKGETVAQSLKERFDFGQNPDKTQGGELISSYECDYMTADAEFLLSKAKYKVTTGRERRRDADVLCYQIRQSFKPGEITPEEANRVATKRRCGQAGAWWCDLVPCARAAAGPPAPLVHPRDRL